MKYIKLFIATLLFMAYASKAQSSNLTLEQAVAFALENNAEIKSAELNIQFAKEKVWETQAIGLPQLNGEIGYNYFLNTQEQPMPNFLAGNFNELVAFNSPIKQNISGTATLSQLLFNGSYLVGLQSVKVYEKISQLAKQKTEIAIKEAVYYTYTGIVITDENIKILEENKKIADKNLHDISEIYKVGLGEEQSVDQMKYNHSYLVVMLTNLKETRKSLINALKLLIGKPQTENISLTTDLQTIIDKNVTLVPNESFDYNNHIDYLFAENEIKSNQLQLKNEKSKFLPSVASFINLSANSYQTEFKFNNLDWYITNMVGLKIDIPIFSSFSRKSKVEQAKINLEKAEITKQHTTEQLQKNATEKKINYENALITYENTKELVALSEKIFTKSQIKFYEGMGTSTELSVAENQKYDAQTKYIDAVYKVIQAKVALNVALGKL